MKTINKLILAFVIVITIIGRANAQKQPQIQEGSVRAPDNIKIDGKLDEWPNKSLNAYNSTSRIYYVISNDDNNLYVTIRGLGTRVSVKALEGGIVFTVSHAIEKKLRAKATENVSITFPVPLDLKSANYILGPERMLKPLNVDSVANRKQIDSIVAIANTRLAAALKEIKVSGIKEIADTSISIYNTEGIKAKALFKNVEPNIELAIPLKYLGLSILNPVKFSYNIKLLAQPDVRTNRGSEEGAIVIITDPDELFLANTTDFWGEYILAKKP